MTDSAEALRVASDSLLRNLDELEALEGEKRGLAAGDPRIVDLARRIEALAKQILEDTVDQRRLTVSRRQAASEGELDATASIQETPRSIAAILQAWRAAERDLAGTIPGTPEAEVAQDQVDRLREEYRRAHKARGPENS